MQQNEFRFLPEHADRIGRLAPLPHFTRLNVTAPSGRVVSALVSDDPLARLPHPIVWLHGAGLNAHTFDATTLGAESNAISIDLPGHGASDWRDDADYSPTTIAADVAATIAELTPRRIHLVGHSLGGLVAAALVPVLRRKLRSVTLIDITPGIDPSTDAGEVSHFIAGKRVFASVDEMIDRAIAFGLGTDRDALTREIALNARQRSDGTWEWGHHFAHLDGLAASGSAGGSRPFEPLWQNLESMGRRVHAVRGSHGLVSPVLESEWRRRLPEADMHTIVAGHNVQELAPRALSHHIRELLCT